MTTPLQPPDTAEVIAQAEQAAETGRRTRDYPMWQGTRRMVPIGAYGDSGPFAFTTETNPDDIGFDIYAMLRMYPAIAAALILLKAPILGRFAQADIDCQDDAKRETLRRLYLDSGLAYRTAETQLSALDWGLAAHEIEWEALDNLRVVTLVLDEGTGEMIEEVHWDGPALAIKRCAQINPTTIKRLKRRTKRADGKPGDGSYDGLIQRGRAGAEEEDVDLRPEETLLFTLGGEFGNLWGRPRTKVAYVYWWWAQQQWKLFMAWGERKVSPARIGYFPEGKSGPPGAEVDNAKIILRTANQLDAVNAVALPSKRDQRGNKHWEVEEKPTTDRSETFKTILDALDTQCFRAMFTPQRLVEHPEDAGGAYSEAQQFADTFLLTLDELLRACADNQNGYLLPRLEAANFPADSPPARLTVTGLTDAERALLLEVFKQVLIIPDNARQLDFRALAKRFNAPLRDLAEIEAEDAAKREQDAQAAGAFGGEPGAVDENGNPIDEGVADTGEPGNLVLSDGGFAALLDYDVAAILADLPADIVQLKEPVDLSIYAISPDPKARNGYKVINKRTGKRVLGFAADAVVKAFSTAGQKAQKAGEIAARKAQREAESARKKGVREATAAQRKRETEAKRQARAGATAAAKAERERVSGEKRSARETKAAATATERERKKGEREQTAAQKKTERETKAKERETQRQDTATARQAEQGEKAITAAAGSERQSLERDTAKVSHADAVTKAKAAGWDVQGGNIVDHTAAVAAARSLAEGNDQIIVTVVKTKDGYAIATKPKKNIKTAQTAPRNVALGDGDEDEWEPDDDAVGLADTDPRVGTYAFAAERIGAILAGTAGPDEGDPDAAADGSPEGVGDEGGQAGGSGGGSAEG